MVSLKSELTKILLNYFFINPHESLYVNELARNLGLDKRNLVKKLRALEEEGILKSQKRGNLKLYSINQAYPLYKEYRNIFLKSVGFIEKLRKALESVDGIKKAYIYGSYAEGKMDVHSDIDLLIIGNHRIMQAQKKISKLQKEIDREINMVNIDSREFAKRIKKKDPFISGVLKKKHIEVIA